MSKDNKLIIRQNLIIFLAMLYLTCKLICNPLFFRQIEIIIPQVAGGSFKISSSAIIYPLIYIISDLIVVFSDRKTGIIITLFGIWGDGFFSFGINRIASLPIPHFMSGSELLNTNAVNLISTQMWRLYYQGVLAAIVAGTAEILIFSFLFKRSKSFLISTLISIIVTLTTHNLINDYQILKHEPDVWHVMIDNWLVNLIFVSFYTILVSISIRIRQYLKNNQGNAY